MENIMEKYFSYLNVLRESGVTNMFGASPYLEKEFGLGRREARDVLSAWMKQFKG
jgi:hypothetical protein